ncbi:lipopolysaccharide biosynthesis protein [Arthrobacter gengyunqii]|uniref:Polysaccharide biosynthesis protein n=1 Tax=Arthrobacter gengyunqii TaxID=2886940 RepID=A0ABS8GLV7_9MICC|nr:hypothetical protein [Arthrobacter gengyunqii]MCC3267158.1 hypothetical protein [Arthrobacter gengyunqii]
MKKVLLYHALVATLGVLVQGVVRFAYTTWIGNTSDVISEVSAVLSLAVYFSLFWPAGAGLAAMRFLPAASIGGPSAGGVMRLLRKSFWVASAAAALVSYPISYYFTGDAAAAAASSFLVVSYGAYTFTRGTLLGHARATQASLLDLVSAAVSFGVLLFVTTSGAHWALLLPLGVGYTVYAVLAWPRETGQRLAASERSQVLSYTGYAIFGLIAAGGLLPAVMLFVQTFDVKAKADLFAAALTLATPANMLAQSLNQVLVQYFSGRAQESARETRKQAVGFFILSVVGFAAIFGALIAMAPWLMDLVFPGRYGGGVATLQVLLAVVAVSSLTAVPGAYLMATGRHRAFSVASFCATVAGIASMAFLAPAWGLEGAIAGFAVGAVASAASVAVLAYMAKPQRVEAPSLIEDEL